MEEPRERERNDDVAERAEAVREARDDPHFGGLQVEEARRFEAVWHRAVAASSSVALRRGKEAEGDVQERRYPC